MYEFYLEAWIGSNGHLTIKQFTTYMLAYEFQPYKNKNLDGDFIGKLKTAAANWFWCSPNPNTYTGCANLRLPGSDINSGLLNWIGAMQSARMRYDNFKSGANAWQQVSASGIPNLQLAIDTLNFVLSESTADGHLYLNQPFYWANLSLPLNPDILKASQGSAYNQYLRVFDRKGDAAFILTPCQNAYWGIPQETSYLEDFCR